MRWSPSAAAKQATLARSRRKEIEWRLLACSGRMAFSVGPVCRTGPLPLGQRVPLGKWDLPGPVGPEGIFAPRPGFLGACRKRFPRIANPSPDSLECGFAINASRGRMGVLAAPKDPPAAELRFLGATGSASAAKDSRSRRSTGGASGSRDLFVPASNQPCSNPSNPVCPAR